MVDFFPSIPWVIPRGEIKSLEKWVDFISRLRLDHFQYILGEPFYVVIPSPSLINLSNKLSFLPPKRCNLKVQQLLTPSTFIALAYEGKDIIVSRFIIKYSSLMDFPP
jgi:hypothetical protein